MGKKTAKKTPDKKKKITKASLKKASGAGANIDTPVNPSSSP